MSAQELTAALGGRWHGNQGMARCPCHDDSTPSLAIRDGDERLLVYCHAGCDQNEVWRTLVERGLVGRPEDRPRPCRPRPKRRPAPAPSDSDRTRARVRAALKIWRASRPAAGTLAEDYLRGRGIMIPLPPTLRYHGALRHPDIGQHLPAMIAAVCDVSRKITAIQRTYLTHDGRKAPLTRPRLAFGTLTGGAVRLAPAIDRVWLTEGVEDGLALMQMTGEPAWATLGTSGFSNVELPENIRQVVLAPDGDEAGQAVIADTANRLAGQGREVRAARLPDGRDWVDVLDTFEERAGIFEFDLEVIRPDAESRARREALR